MPSQSLMIDHKPAAQVNQASAIFHGGELFFAKQILVLRLAVDMQSDYVGRGQQFMKADGPRISASQNMRHVIKHNPHSQSFGQIRNLRSDLSIADDAESEPAHFMRPRRRFVPDSAMQLRAGLKRPPHQQDDLSHGQLSHGPAVRVRIVKHCNPTLARCCAVDLVDADAKRSYRYQLRSGVQNGSSNVSLRADAQNRSPAHLLNQFAFLESALKRLDSKARFLKLRSRDAANILQQ